MAWDCASRTVLELLSIVSVLYKLFVLNRTQQDIALGARGFAWSMLPGFLFVDATSQSPSTFSGALCTRRGDPNIRSPAQGILESGPGLRTCLVQTGAKLYRKAR